MKYRLYLPFTFVLSFILLNTASSQYKKRNYITNSQRFSAGLFLALNNTQIDGDYFTGFDKKGIVGGIRGIVRLTPRINFNIEMLYSQKGSKIPHGHSLTAVRRENDRIIDLHYIDVPFLFKYLLKNKESTWHVEVGPVFSRLISTKITEQIEENSRGIFSYQMAANDFNKNDFSVLAGFGYTLKNGIALHLRYVFGVTKFYNNENFFQPPPHSLLIVPVHFLRNYHYSLGISYDIFTSRNSKK
jgi:hypothetical protein